MAACLAQCFGNKEAAIGGESWTRMKQSPLTQEKRPRSPVESPGGMLNSLIAPTDGLQTQESEDADVPLIILKRTVS